MVNQRVRKLMVPIGAARSHDAGRSCSAIVNAVSPAHRRLGVI